MYDLALIGLGPAGHSVIEIALKNNLKVIAFDENKPGGTCLNTGCIPTKSILHCANFYNEMKNCAKLGIEIKSDPNFNWGEILERKTNIVSKFNKVLESFYSKNIKLVNSKAELVVKNDSVEISAQNDIYKAKNIIIATGSRPRALKGLEFDSKFILNSDDLYNLSKLPKKIAIVGSGAIGLEWAMIFAQLDVEVKIIEKMPCLAPLFDVDIQKRIERILKQNKIKFYKNDYIAKINGKTLILNSKEEFDVDCVLVAAGREPVLPDVKTFDSSSKCKLEIFKNCETNFKNVYVAGDVLNDVMLAHSASFSAKCVMDKILFNKEIKNKQIPSVIYITPEIASVGIREQDICENNDYKIKKLMITSIAKSWCDEAADGFVKIILKNDKIKGAHVVSKEACSLISLFNVFMDLDVEAEKIKNIIFPHPSFEEAVLEVLKID